MNPPRPGPPPPPVIEGATASAKSGQAYVRLRPGLAAVRVRMRVADRGWLWNCDACGHQQVPTCAHAAAVAAWAAQAQRRISEGAP